MHNRTLIFGTAIVFGFIMNSCSKPERAGQTEPKMVLQDEHFTLFRYTEHGQEWFAVRTSATVRSGTFAIEVILDRELTIQDSRIVSYPLSRGREVLKPVFLSQFNEKTDADPIRIGVDIHAVTGATLSSIAVSNAVRDSLAFASRYRHRIIP